MRRNKYRYMSMCLSCPSDDLTGYRYVGQLNWSWTLEELVRNQAKRTLILGGDIIFEDCSACKILGRSFKTDVSQF